MRSSALLALIAIVSTVHAKAYQPCGGLAPNRDCACGYTCIDDPRIEGCGMACDRPGICVSAEKNGDIMCGGIAGFRCKDSKRQCYDAPNDGCDPKKGGRDCSGICLYKL